MNRLLLIAGLLGCRATGPAATAAPLPATRTTAPPTENAMAASVETPARRTIAAAPAPCAIRSTDEIACIDERTTDEVVFPVFPDELPEGERWAELATASERICALTAPSGLVRCWTWGSGYGAPRPEEDPGVTGAIDLAVGELHGCVLYKDGSVGCWGNNDRGQLGDGTREQHPTPVPVPLQPALAIAASRDGSCALLQSGGVACWGSNPTPDDPRRLEPSMIEGTKDVVQLRPDDRAVTSEGTVIGWKVVNHLPQDFTPATRVKEDDGCTLQRGKVTCPATKRTYSRPATRGFEVTGVKELAIGGYAGCMRMQDDRVQCWGRFVQQERAGEEERLEPGPVRGVERARAVAVGDAHACALLEGGEVECWGDGWVHAEEDSGVQWSGTPSTVPFEGKIESITVSSRFVCGETRGRQQCIVAGYGATPTAWAAKDLGRIVSGPAASDACRMGRAGLECASYYYLQRGEIRWDDPLRGRAPVAVGLRWTCLVAGKGEGKVHCFFRDEPVEIDLGPVTQLAVGELGVCGVRSDGTVKCHALYDYRRGYDEEQEPAPIQPPPRLGPARSVGVGSVNACALLRDGSVTCWGEEPVAHPDRIHDAVQLSVGASTSCVVRRGGQVWCWGNDRFGQLGAGGISRVHTDVPVVIDALSPR